MDYRMFSFFLPKIGQCEHYGALNSHMLIMFKSYLRAHLKS